jgi:tetratricopeptide (TPR) repeat protein
VTTGGGRSSYARSMSRRFSLLTTVVLAVVVLPITLPAQPPAARAIERGDSLLAAFHTREAIAAYRGGLVDAPEDPTLLWKAAHASMTLSAETADTREDEMLLAEAVALARRAVRAGPELARAHTALAASLGLYGRHLGHHYRVRKAREVIDIGREVHVEAQRALELDPNDFAPYLILGMWHRELATVHPIAKAVARTFLGGYPDVSLPRSERYLRRAVELAPEDVTARLELARTYIAMDREAEARDELRRVLTLPAKEKLDLVEQGRARELLDRIG